MLEPGTTIGGYRIGRCLGQGGMGVVYEAWQYSLQRPVALKIVNGRLDSDVFRARFKREGRAQSSIVHPNVVGVFEAGEAGGYLFIAMQLIRGCNLKELIQLGELTPGRALALLGQIADALDAAHAAGLTHRDVKPQNILVDRSEHAYLADFGLTKTVQDSRRFTRTGHIVGSYEYISPEQVQAQPATPASDIYALTAIVYECLCGEAPFPLEDDAALLYAHAHGQPPRVTAQRPELSERFDALIEDGMAKDPALRPASARELIDRALDALDDGAPPMAKPERRLRRRLLTAGAVVVALGAFGQAVGPSDTPVGRTGSQTVSNTRFELTYPAGWERAEWTPATRSLGLEFALIVAPPRGGGAGVAVGVMDNGAGFNSSLPYGYTEALKARFPDLEAPLPAPERAWLGKLFAFRYTGVQAGAQRYTVYAAPTLGGVITVLAADTPAAASVVRSLQIGTRLTLGPDYAHVYGEMRDKEPAETESRRGRWRIPSISYQPIEVPDVLDP